MKQFTNIVCKQAFTMRYEGKGRSCNVKIGDVFTITNPCHMQDKGIKIMRAKNARLNEGYLLSASQIVDLFTIQN